MKTRLNQIGFIATEYVLMAAIAIVVLTAGFFIFIKSGSAQSIILAKQKYIDEQLSGLNESNYTQLANELYKGGYITNSLFNATQSLINSYSDDTFSSNSAYSTMICISSLPNKFSYGHPQLNSNNAASLSVGVYTPLNSLPTRYSANWILSGSWKLNSVSC